MFWESCCFCFGKYLLPFVIMGWDNLVPCLFFLKFRIDHHLCGCICFPKVSSALLIKIYSPGVAKDLARRIQALLTCCTLSSILSLRVLITSGCISSATPASFQLISGSNAASQGYPRIILSSPKLVTRNFISLVCDPHCTWRSGLYYHMFQFQDPRQGLLFWHFCARIVIEWGFADSYLHANMLLTPNVHAQASGVAHLKNPYLHLQPIFLPPLPF